MIYWTEFYIFNRPIGFSFVYAFCVFGYWYLLYRIASKLQPEKKYLNYQMYEIIEQLVVKQIQLEENQTKIKKELKEGHKIENEILQIVKQIQKQYE